MKNIAKYLVIATVVILHVSCAVDSEKPSIVINEPSNDEVFDVGSEIHLDFVITDNDELSQFKIDIHGDHDGHTHGKLALVLPAFDTIIVENINGNNVNRHVHINIPNGIWPGPYHMLIFASDKSGNEAMEMRTIKIRNSIDLLSPVVNITSPSDGTSLGNTFSVSATITDKLSDNVTDGEIRQIEVKLVNGSQEFSLGKYDEVSNFNGTFNQTTGQFSSSFNLPTGITSGTWELEIEAYDSYFNQAHGHIDVIVP